MDDSKKRSQLVTLIMAAHLDGQPLDIDTLRPMREVCEITPRELSDEYLLDLVEMMQKHGLLK